MRKADYWNHKLSVYLHDPLDKAFQIVGHKDRAARLRDMFEVETPDESLMDGDWIASALDRAMTPGHDRDESASGAVDFQKSPAITHPTGKENPCRLELPSISAKELTDAVIELVDKDLHKLSIDWEGHYDRFAFVKFLYLHLALRHRLADKNIGDLGALWHRLPADTRIPDHSIWHHNALVSALDICQSEGKGPSLFVYSLTPIQKVIANSRKLQDFWTGSVLISWLAFEGLRSVVEHWGPDHIIYPSLFDQPLVDHWLVRQYRLFGLVSEDAGLKNRRDFSIASFPNKFVLLAPVGQEQATAAMIRGAIDQAWQHLATQTLGLILDRLYGEKSRDTQNIQKLKEKFPTSESLAIFLDPQFRAQVDRFWEHAWASVPLLGAGQKERVENLLGGNFPRDSWSYAESSSKVSPYHQKARHNASGAFYPITHRVVQTGLAATKATRIKERAPQKGIKCSMEPELSILTVEPGENPAPREDLLWNVLRDAFNPQGETAGSDIVIKESERLSPISLMKRFAHKVCTRKAFQGDPSHFIDERLHVLDCVLGRPEGFESSTEMALTDWFDRNGIADRKIRRTIAQLLHESPREEVEDQSLDRLIWKHGLASKLAQLKGVGRREVLESERYYAFVVMDGDKMGDLVNGDTLASCWCSVLHPDLVSRMQNNVGSDGVGFDPKLVDHWQKYLLERRVLSPAVHASISEALGDFAIYGVSSITQRHRGRLIYAGGDDICAVFPVSEVVDAVLEIEKLYRAGFLLYSQGVPSQPVRYRFLNGKEPVKLQPGKLSVHLGRGEKLTISAGVVIAHHKAPLTHIYRKAQDLLKHEAKDKAGRSAMSLCLLKRAGAARTVTYRFTDSQTGETLSHWSDLLDFAQKLGQADKQQPQISGSLLYRLEEKKMKEGLQPLIDSRRKLQDFIAYQIDHSGISKKLWPDPKEREQKTRELAEQMVRLSVRDGEFKAEVFIVARFIGERLVSMPQVSN